MGTISTIEHNDAGSRPCVASVANTGTASALAVLATFDLTETR